MYCLDAKVDAFRFVKIADKALKVFDATLLDKAFKHAVDGLPQFEVEDSSAQAGTAAGTAPDAGGEENAAAASKEQSSALDTGRRRIQPQEEQEAGVGCMAFCDLGSARLLASSPHLTLPTQHAESKQTHRKS